MSNPSKPIVAVFTASNEIGFRVAKGLSQDYKVRAILREDEGSDVVDELRNCGVEVCQLREYNEGIIRYVLEDCHGCFLATKTVFTEPNFQHNEIEIGTMVVEQCKVANVKHLVHLTHVTVEFSIGILAREHDTKEYIERAIRQKNIPATGLILPVPFEVLLKRHKPHKMQNNFYQLEIPLGETPFDGISLDNVGEIVGGIFRDGVKAVGKDYAVTAGKLTVEDWAMQLSAHMRPKHFRDAKITVRELRQRQFPGCEDIANMYEFMGRMDLRHNVDLSRRLCPNLLTFEQWVQKHKQDLENVL